MKTRYKIILVLGISLLLVLFAYFIGSKIIDKKFYFEAKIIDINNSSILIDGLDTNDINHKGEFSFGVKETKVLKGNKKIEYNELKIGDKVGVKYTGVVMESYPAQINVTKLIVIN